MYVNTMYSGIMYISIEKISKYVLRATNLLRYLTSIVCELHTKRNKEYKHMIESF